MPNENTLQRRFLPNDLVVQGWEDIQPYADDLLNRQWTSLQDFEKWLMDWSELQCVTSEISAWRSIRVTLNTIDEKAKEEYDSFLRNVSVELDKLSNGLQKRALNSEYAASFQQDGFAMVCKRWQTAIDLFREENIPLAMEDAIQAKDFGKIRGAMTVTLDGEEMTLQKATTRLEWQDRAKREEAWLAARNRAFQDKAVIDGLMSNLVSRRHRIAENAGYQNYRDYKFKQLQRFDYTPVECFGYHDAVEKEVLPVVKLMDGQRAKSMGLELLRPWDVQCDPLGRTGLKAFSDADELVDKSIATLNAVDPDFGKTIALMKKQRNLDLASRPNKSPGAYNSRLNESRTSFMFGNVTGRASDMSTFMHEAGHAVHNTLMNDLPLLFYRSYTMEVAELASQSMELMTHDEWYRFFPDELECRRAKLDHIHGLIDVLVHIAKIDAFQHKIYETPDLAPEQRHDFYEALQKRYQTGWVDWSGLDHFRRTAWQWQLHIFEVPFYYIEYGIAQLGALQVWRNYKQDPKQALKQYKHALSLGYTKSIPEIYEAAGIKFDFSAGMMKELMAFVQKEMAALV